MSLEDDDDEEKNEKIKYENVKYFDLVKKKLSKRSYTLSRCYNLAHCKSIIFVWKKKNEGKNPIIIIIINIRIIIFFVFSRIS